MRSSIRTSPLVLLMSLSAVLAGASSAHAEKCQQIYAHLSTQFGTCPSDFQSPIGLCSASTLSAPFYRGQTRFRANTAAYSAGMTGVEPASTLSYAGDFQLTDDYGTFAASDVGLSDTANKVFTEISRVTSGTGSYANAHGVLFISGTSSADGTSFEAQVTGQICFDTSAVATSVVKRWSKR